MTAPDLYILNAAFSYKKQILFSQLNLHLPAGKWIALLGPSGVGKSSLLRMIAGLTGPQEKFHGEIRASNHLPLHQQIAYMGQTDLLLPWLNVLDNTMIGFKLRHYTYIALMEKTNQASILLEKVGLGQSLYLYPHQLSGGMRQRTALVRTLIEDKPIVLMDEPFSSLDAITRHKLQNLAAELLQNKTVLFITHDPTEALRLGNEIYIMQNNPAVAKHVLSLESSAPRDLADKEVISHQALLFHELVLAAGST